MAETTGIEPEALTTYPKIPEAYQEFGDAFTMLSSRRTYGMQANPISLAEIDAYIRLYGAPAFGTDLFVQMIIVMDAKYLELTSKK